MVVRNRVPELVAGKFGKREINLKEIQRETGLNYATVSSWVKGHVNRADFPVLAVWCKYLNCTVGDLLVFEESHERN